jgi:hypothetical protein
VGKALPFLHADEVYRYRPCGGRLAESVEPTVERHRRLVIPERMRGTLLHRQLERREVFEVLSAATGISTSSPTKPGRTVRMRSWSRETKETPSGSG